MICYANYKLIYFVSVFQQKELTAVEANAILYTEHEIRTLGAIHTTYPRYANAETVRIAHLYVKIYMMISRCMSACGLHKLTVSFEPKKKKTKRFLNQ